MEYYEEDEGVSLGQIFKVIFRRWKLLLIITGAIFVLGLLGSQLLYNKIKTNYTTTVEYNVVGINDGLYFDNSKFNYRDLIKIDNLNKVKEKEAFSSIDVQKLIENEDISIERNVKEVTGSNQIVFTITAKAKYFKDSNQAKSFFLEVMSQPVYESIEIATKSNHKVYLKAYNQAKDFESEIYYLTKEVDYLFDNYTKLINMYGDVDSNISATDNEMISTYQVLLANEFGKLTGTNSYKVIDDLNNELKAFNYVKDFDDNKTVLENKKASLETNIEENEKIILDLEESIKKYNGGTSLDISAHPNDAYTPFTSQIADLTKQNAKMKVELEIVNNQLDNNGGDANKIAKFDEKLDNYYDKLDQLADIYQKVSTSVVKTYSSVEYTGKAIESSGGLGLIISALLFLVGGFVVAAIVNLIIDRKYLKEDNNKADVKNEEKLVEANNEENKQ